MPMANRNLFEMISNERLAADDIDSIAKVALDLGRLIQNIHTAGVIHSDVKPVRCVSTDPLRISSGSRAQAAPRIYCTCTMQAGGFQQSVQRLLRLHRQQPGLVSTSVEIS